MENAAEVILPLTKTVLVVDDHPNTADMLARAIRTIEIAPPLDVFTAESGEEALEQLRARSIEVLIVDYLLPGMNGLDLVVALREAGQMPENVILISAYTVLDSEIKSRELDIDARFSKPVKTEKILNLVRGLLIEPASSTKSLNHADGNGAIEELPSGEDTVQPAEENAS